jgi:hypothetical protein
MDDFLIIFTPLQSFKVLLDIQLEEVIFHGTTACLRHLGRNDILLRSELLENSE